MLFPVSATYDRALQHPVPMTPPLPLITPFTVTPRPVVESVRLCAPSAIAPLMTSRPPVPFVPLPIVWGAISVSEALIVFDPVSLGDPEMPPLSAIASPLMT